MQAKPSPSTAARIQEASSLFLVTALCGAGGTLTATQADAAVVSTPGISPTTPLVVPDTLDGVYIDVVTGGTGTTPATAPAGWDLNPYTASAGNLNWWGATTTTFLQPAGSASLGRVAVPLGTVVNSGGTFVRGGGGNPAIAGTGIGEFTLGTTNYVGFQFTNENGGGTHYGYFSILLGATFSERSLTGIFYENVAGTPITVGAIPEPTGALLAAGAAGLLTLRRRRQAA